MNPCHKLLATLILANSLAMVSLPACLAADEPTYIATLPPVIAPPQVTATPVLIEDDSKKDIDTLVASFKAAAEKRGVKRSEVDETVNQVNRLLASTDGKMSISHREDLAHQLLSHGITPMTVKHGIHNTALIASLESRLYEVAPSTVAKVIADIALNGSAYAGDSSELSLDPRNLTQSRSAGFDGERSFASQLFQVAMVNAHCQLLKKDPNGHKVKNGKLHFVQTQDRKNSNDTGERLIIVYDDGAKETLLHEGSYDPISDVGMTMDKLQTAYGTLTGRADFDTLGKIEQRQNPSRFITLGETTVITSGATELGVRLGNGWTIAKGNCSNGMCKPTRKPQVEPGTLAVNPQ